MDQKHPRRRSSDTTNATLTPEAIAADLALLRQYTVEEFRKSDERMTRFHRDLQANTAVTQRIEKGQDEILEILQLWKAGQTFLISIGRITGWVVSVAGTVALIVAALRGKLW